MAQTIERLERIRAAMREPFAAAGVKMVEATYDGSGDSGAVEEITFYAEYDPEKIERGCGDVDLGKPLDPAEINPKVKIAGDVFSGPRIYNPDEGRMIDATAAAEGLAYVALETRYAGWENDGGAHGVVRWFVDSNKIRVEHNWRIEATEYDEAEI